MALTDNLVAFWKLDEASGTRNDSVGSNHLTDNNTVTQATGKVGNAAQFVQVNGEFLSLTDNAAVSTGDIDFTICAWAYMDSNPGQPGIVTKWNGAANEYILYYNAGFKFGVMGAGFTEVGSTTATLATWHFVVCWHDATADTINIQVDNGSVQSTSHTTGVNDSDSVFKIGAWTIFWDGRIDAVGLWKRLLTTDERTELYNSGNGWEPTGIPSGFRLNKLRPRIFAPGTAR